MIKPPFTARQGISGAWIEDADGLSIADINPLLDSMEAFRIAELLAIGANQYIRLRERAPEVGKLGGRPPSKKPTKAALAKRKSRAKLKQS